MVIEQAQFQSSGRVVIEQAFGLLKGRFEVKVPQHEGHSSCLLDDYGGMHSAQLLH